MRVVQKQGTGGFHLNAANAHPPHTPQQATSRWGSFSHKVIVLQLLLDEQYQLCCYSELRADEEGLGYHIEHVENKRQNPSRTFDYSNLAASALDSVNDLEAFNAQGASLFGGHAPGKQTACDMLQFVRCHQPDCGRFFAYLSDGRIVPVQGLDPDETERSRYTIEVLNLNSPFLVTRRRQWWAELDFLYGEHTQKNWSLEDLVAIDLIPANAKLSRFFSLTRQFFGPVAEEVLQQYAPDLA